MIWALILAFLRPGLDLGGVLGGVADVVGGFTSPSPDYYRPQGTRDSDVAFMQALEAISQATNRNTGMVDPVLLHSYSQMLGIDLSGLVTAGATAGDQYRQLATQTAGFGQDMAGAGKQILNQAFDPQNALHDFSRQQTIDTSRAADTSRGLAMSPYSSGNESTAARNFEMDWQNRQLGREMAGAGGANAAYGAASGYGAATPGFTMAGAQAPIAGQTAAYGAPMGFSNQFLQAENNMMAPQASLASGLALPYLQYGTNAASNQFNQAYGAHAGNTGMIAGGFNNMFGGGAGDPSQWFGFQGGNPFSMSNWGGASAGGGGGAAGASMFAG